MYLRVAQQAERITEYMRKLVLLLSALLLTVAGVSAKIKPGQTTLLKGKNIAVFGDSYVRNHHEPVSNTWHYKFAKKYGMHYFNYGINGNCVALDRAQYGKAMYHRYGEMRDSIDYLVIIAGHNDASLLDSIGIDCYRDKADKLCRGLKTKWPKAQIVWFTPWRVKGFRGGNFEQVVKATKKVCCKYGIPVFDSARDYTIKSDNDKFRELYFQNQGHGDMAHLNAKGHDLFEPVAERFLLRVFK